MVSFEEVQLRTDLRAAAVKHPAWGWRKARWHLLEQPQWDGVALNKKRIRMPMFGLSSDQERQGMETRDELEGELIRPEPDSGRIKKLVGKAVEVAALGTTSGVVEAFIGLTEKFMGSN